MWWDLSRIVDCKAIFPGRREGSAVLVVEAKAEVEPGNRGIPQILDSVVKPDDLMAALRRAEDEHGRKILKRRFLLHEAALKENQAGE